MSEHEQSLDDVIAEVHELEQRKDGAHRALDARIDLANEVQSDAESRDREERFVTYAETAAKFLALEVEIQRLTRAVATAKANAVVIAIVVVLITIALTFIGI